MTTYELRTSSDACIREGDSLQELRVKSIRAWHDGLTRDPVADMAHIVLIDSEGMETYMPWYMVKKFYDSVREECPEDYWEDEDCKRERVSHAFCD